MNFIKRNINFGKILILISLINIFIINNSNVYAKINPNYAEKTLSTDVDVNENSVLTIIGDVVLPVVLPAFTMVESLTSELMLAITNEKFFPWADMIIYNAVPLLDVNFINPSVGSLFIDISGNETVIGKTLKSVYFSALSIALGFLTLAVAINAIKLAITTIAGEKAKYKEMINRTVLTIILLFSLHYGIAFIFYLNEQLVTVASAVMQQVVSNDTTNKAIKTMNDASDEDNDKIVENFFDTADKTSLTPITITKKAAKEIVNIVSDVYSKFKNGSNTADLHRDERNNEPFPSKDNYIDKIKSLDNGMDVAAYLLKDYIYRQKRLTSVAKNDANKFSQSGIKGPLTSLKNTVLWVTGIVDTGLLGLQNLYNDVYSICVEMDENNIISSSKQYTDQVNYYAKIINDPSSSGDQRDDANISILFLEAYYRYVYDGDDKGETGIKNIVANLGTYFKRNIYYVDVDAGQWAPKKFNIIPCILYCMFILQSMMFLFSYIKRFLYVIILALIGPIVVIFDYVMKSL